MRADPLSSRSVRCRVASDLRSTREHSGAKNEDEDRDQGRPVHWWARELSKVLHSCTRRGPGGPLFLEALGRSSSTPNQLHSVRASLHNVLVPGALVRARAIRSHANVLGHIERLPLREQAVLADL